MRSGFGLACILFSLSSLARFHSEMQACLCCMFCSRSNLAPVKFDMVNYYRKLSKQVGWLIFVGGFLDLQKCSHCLSLGCHQHVENRSIR